MPSIRDFLGRSDRDERPARFIEAILDESTFTVVVRDHRGRFVEAGPAHLEAAGTEPEEAGPRGEHLRYFDEDGREMPFLETAAALARASGQPQRRQIFCVRYPNGREVWLKGDQLPLEQGTRGWAVLGLSVDVTDLYTGRRDAQKRVGQLEALLEVSQALSGTVTRGKAPLELCEPLTRPLPPAWLGLGIREGDNLVLRSISQWPNDSVPRSGPWRMESLGNIKAGTHVNLDVQDTDIYGFFAVGELDRPFRSIVNVALDGVEGWLIAAAFERDAFDTLDVQFLEEAARLITPALRSEQRAA